MPKTTISVEHKFFNENAKSKLKEKLENRIKNLIKNFGSLVDDYKYNWLGYTVNFSCSGRGTTIEGTLTIEDSKTIIEFKYSVFAKFFIGKAIEKIIQELKNIITQFEKEL